jgi:hypothetical protein
MLANDYHASLVAAALVSIGRRVFGG